MVTNPPPPGFCLTTRARVARTRSRFIPEGDGVLSTHTPQVAAPDRTVTDRASAGATHPFADNPPISQPAPAPTTARAATEAP